MFNSSHHEAVFKRNEKKLQDLLQEVTTLNEAVENFYKDCQLGNDLLQKYSQDSDNFSEISWNKLEEERLKLADKLKKDLHAIRNPLETAKKYKERQVAPHWLFVR